MGSAFKNNRFMGNKCINTFHTFSLSCCITGGAGTALCVTHELFSPVLSALSALLGNSFSGEHIQWGIHCWVLSVGIVQGALVQYCGRGAGILKRPQRSQGNL